eukprot:410684-Amphidinium_carterae.1
MGRPSGIQLKELEMAKADGNIPRRSALAKKWQRHIKQQGGDPNDMNLKKLFLNNMWKEASVVASKKEVAVESQTKQKRGEYLNFYQLKKEIGVVSAKEYVRTCEGKVGKGSPKCKKYISYCPVTKETLYLYVKKAVVKEAKKKRSLEMESKVELDQAKILKKAKGTVGQHGTKGTGKKEKLRKVGKGGSKDSTWEK